MATPRVPSRSIARFRKARTVVLAVVAALAAGAVPAAAQAHSARSYNGARYALYLNRQLADVPTKVTLVDGVGGSTAASFSVYLPDAALSGLVNGALTGLPRRVSAEIQTLDYDYKPRSSALLQNVRVKEVDFPTFDSRSKDGTVFAFTLFPTRSAPGRSTLDTNRYEKTLRKQPAPMASNFRLQIDGVDCTSVGAVKLPPAVSSGGRLRLQGAMTVTVSSTTISAFRQWLASPAAKNGTLTLLTPDLKTPIYVISLVGLRIQSMSSGTSSQSAQIAISGIRLKDM
jgi:hypothetical protein